MLNIRNEATPTKRCARVCAVFAATLAITTAATAQTDGGLLDLQRDLEETRMRLAELESRLSGMSGAQPASSSGADERLDALEDAVFELEDRVGSRTIVNAFDALELNIGGFITQTFTLVDGQDDDEASFDQTLFELLLSAQISEDVSLFTALGFLRAADLDLSTRTSPNFRDFATRIPPIIAWADWQPDDSFGVRIGRFVTPHGIINIEHFPPVLLELNQPQFLRPFPGATMFPNFQNGVDVHGRFFTGKENTDVLEYNVYAGVFTNGDPEEFLAGARLAYTFGDTGLTVGGNYSHGRRKAGAPPLGSLSIVGAKSLVSNEYDMVGADVLYDKDSILWKTELFYSSEGDQDDRFAFYTQPAVRMGDKWIAFYRYDYLDPGQGLAESVEHVVGVNYLPVPTVRLRAAYIHKELNSPDEEVGVFQLSATISF